MGHRKKETKKTLTLTSIPAGMEGASIAITDYFM